MSLQDLQSTFQPLATAGTLTCASLGGTVSTFGPVFLELQLNGSNVLEGATLALTGSGATQELTITATLDIGLPIKVGGSFTIAPDPSLEGAYVTGVTLALPPSASVGLPGVSWFSFGDFSLSGASLPYALGSSDLQPSAIVTLRTTLTISGDSSKTPIPIAIGDDPTGALLLTLDTSAIDLPSIDDILAAFGGGASSIHLPPAIDSLLNFSLQELEVAFDPAAQNPVSLIAVQIGNSAKASGGWPIIPNYLTVESYTLGLSIANPFAGPQVGGTIATTVMLGTVDIAVAATHPASGGWIFQGAIGALNPVPIGQLLTGLGDTFHVTLPDALRSLTLKNFVFAFDTSTGEVNGGFTLDFMVGATPVELSVAAALAPDGPKYDVVVTGELTIGSALFDVHFSMTPGVTSFTAKWSEAANPLEFADIAAAFGWTSMPAIPENLSLALTDVEFTYDSNGGAIALSAHSLHYGQFVFATLQSDPTSPTPNQRLYLLALDVPLKVQLSQLPVLGPQLPAGLQLGVNDLQVIAASSAIVDVDMKALNKLLVGTLGDTPLAPPTLGAGLTFATALQLASDTKTIVIPLTGGSNAPPAPAPAPAGAPAATPAPAPAPAYQSNVKWFTVGKTLGPVQIDRIGLQYEQGTLSFLLDATLSFSVLSLSCEGLGFGSALAAFTPTFHLDGLAVSFSSGPITINGGLLVVPPPLPPGVTGDYLIGEVTIEVQPWIIAGVASYARMGSASSFFVFAQVKGEFGGPPAFFITGFMGGFGYNSRLTLPAPEEVYKFPFVAGLDDPAVFGANPTPMSVLTTLAGSPTSPGVVVPTLGEYWIAAGIMFRSYELILGRALVVVEFGDDLEIALLGLASMSLPQGETTEAYAFVELQLEAIFEPNAGYFGITASLTPTSFLLTKSCHLTGGFAFCLWYGPNAHAGDFVVTIGGYHPAFTPPAWYPKVPVVGFNWQVDDTVTIKGGVYFALTPSAVMAGGRLEALFESGDIKAWFIAYANLLISWKPFHFNAGIGISIGASVRVDLLFTTVTLTFELGASVELWGPPTGGIVHVHLYIVSFAIPFGSSNDRGAPDPLEWDGFSLLLPQPNAAGAPAPEARHAVAALAAAPAPAPSAPPPLVLGVTVNAGLTRQDASGQWFVRADELRFTTSSAVPPTSFTLGSGAAPPLAAGAKAVTPPASIAIRPMAVASATCSHEVMLTFVDESASLSLAGWTQVPKAGNLPEAMWGAPLPAGSPPVPSSATVNGLPTGMQLIAPPATAGASPGPMNLDGLVDPLGGGYLPLTPASQADPIAAPVADATIIRLIGTTLGSSAAQTAQQGLLAALTAVNAAPPTHALLVQLAAQAGQAFVQPPLRAA